MISLPDPNIRTDTPDYNFLLVFLWPQEGTTSVTPTFVRFFVLNLIDLPFIRSPESRHQVGAARRRPFPRKLHFQVS